MYNGTLFYKKVYRESSSEMVWKHSISSVFTACKYIEPSFCMTLLSLGRAPDKKDDLMIIWENFLHFSTKIYDVVTYKNRLSEAILMSTYKICCHGAILKKNYPLNTLLHWSAVSVILVMVPCQKLV